MKTKVEEATKIVKNVKMSQIVENTYNPRKFFGPTEETALNELSDSIKQVGVLQNILLRKKGKKYEIVYGERRFKASKIAGLETIPAAVLELTDEQALEICIMENLQRLDIRPIEEAGAFSALLETKRYDYAAVAEKVGKSVAYVRNRIRLNELIQPIAEMTNNEEILLGIALCIATYPENIQTDVYEKHLQNRHYNYWGNMTVKSFTQAMENKYSLLLENYGFDKTPCAGCPHNSNSYSLFNSDREGKCTKRDCLTARNSQFLTEEILKIANEQNVQHIQIERYSNNIENEVIETLENEGLFFNDENCYESPKAPEEPVMTNFEDQDDYNEAMESYREELTEYEQEKAEFESQLAKGKIQECIYVEKNGVGIVYFQVEEQDDQESCENDQTTDQTNEPDINVTAEINKLKSQDQRNKEIETEHIIEDTKKAINSVASYNGELSEVEKKMMYYFMIGSVSYDKQNLITSCDGHISPAQKREVIEDLSTEQMTLIIREYLRSNFIQSTFRGSVATDLFLEFAALHCPDQLAEIRQKYGNIYDKRKTRIDQRLAELGEVSKEEVSDSEALTIIEQEEVTEEPANLAEVA